MTEVGIKVLMKRCHLPRQGEFQRRPGQGVNPDF
jgi:hypothetical protein